MKSMNQSCEPDADQVDTHSFGVQLIEELQDIPKQGVVCRGIGNSALFGLCIEI